MDLLGLIDGAAAAAVAGGVFIPSPFPPLKILRFVLFLLLSGRGFDSGYKFCLRWEKRKEKGIGKKWGKWKSSFFLNFIFFSSSPLLLP